VKIEFSDLFIEYWGQKLNWSCFSLYIYIESKKNIDSCHVIEDQ
jgi:hypothetical protein